MSQMSYADRQLETALTAMFERKVTENRSTMRYWPAVSDRLGEQVSRRPWEYVMDAINKPRMPFNKQYIYTAAAGLVVAIAALLLLLFLNTDDSTSGESVPANSPEMSVPDSGDSEPVVDGDSDISETEATGFVAPTIESVSDLSASEAILLGLGDQRPFPSAILNDAERLPREEVIALWTGYLGDTRVIDSQNVNMVDFCADGTGYFFRVTTQNFAQMAEESFDWEVLAAIGGRWNESKLRITPLDTSIVLANLSGNPYNESVLRAPTDPQPERSANAFARVENLPGILHPNEFDGVFTFGNLADTICGR